VVGTRSQQDEAKLDERDKCLSQIISLKKNKKIIFKTLNLVADYRIHQERERQKFWLSEPIYLEP